MTGSAGPSQEQPGTGAASAVSTADGLIIAGMAVAAIGFGLWYLPAAFVAIGGAMVWVGLKAARRER